jgi:hypothetical protein
MSNIDSYCTQIGNKNFDGTPYRIGNPMIPTTTNFGFINWLRDYDWVSDGVIKADNCACDIKNYVDDTNLDKQ